MIRSYTRGWVMALFMTFVGCLIWQEAIVLSTHAWAILVLLMAFVLWYDVFANAMMIREEKKMAEKWNKEMLVLREQEKKDENPDEQTEPWSGQ